MKKKKNRCNYLHVSRQLFLLMFNYMSVQGRCTSEILDMFDCLELCVNVHRERHFYEYLIRCLRKSTFETGVEILGIFHFH